MLEITLRHIDGRWYWKSNNNSSGCESCETSGEAVAAAIAAEAATQEYQAAHARTLGEKAEAMAAALRHLR